VCAGVVETSIEIKGCDRLKGAYLQGPRPNVVGTASVTRLGLLLRGVSDYKTLNSISHEKLENQDRNPPTLRLFRGLEV
jgi:hypothetical protein